MKRILCFIVGSFALATAQAASFDCKKAAKKIEKLICGDVELSRLDEELSTAYKAALKDVKHAGAIKQSQMQWTKERNKYSDAANVKWAYEKQLLLLKLPIITTATGQPIAGRTHQTATLLSNGKVLITGGVGGDIHHSAEFYDPATNHFIATSGFAVTSRSAHTATLLPNGKVLVTGGELISEEGPHINTTIFDSAELYDPASGRFSVTESLATKREFHTATLLPNGKVLIEGIALTEMVGGSVAPSAELYDPTTGKFSSTDRLADKRGSHTATLLLNGKVLITGGDGAGSSYLASAELYDPSAGLFSTTGKLITGRIHHTATLLPSGKVLIVGGNFAGRHLASAELYDPSTGRFTATGNIITARYQHTATLLPNGRVLIVGGTGSYGHLASIELYDPATGTFSSIGRMIVERPYHTATLLPNGKVLIVGWDNTAELYDPAR